MDARPPAPAVRAVDLARAASDLEYYVAYLRDYLDYTEADRQRVLRSATMVLPQSREVLDAVYGRLLAFSSTRRYFVGADGEIDQVFLEKRRKTLFEWFAHTARGALDQPLARYVAEVAEKHLERSEAGAEPVPLEEVDTLFGVLQVELLQRLAGALDDVQELVQAETAWIKMLTAQRALFSRAYAQIGRRPARRP